VADTDSVEYARNLNGALIAFEACLKISPWNEQTLDLYPLLLVQAYRDKDAKEFLTSLSKNVPRELEERVVYSTLSGLVRGGVTSLALEWLSERIFDDPDRLFYYQVQFSLYQSMGRIMEATQIADSWQHHSGERDPAMDQGLLEMRNQQLEREQKRIQDAVGEQNE